jgi:DNA helicase-4
MRSLKRVLIDEYQDCSPQFFALLQSLRQHNPNIRLFCVGDDWQAINRFAGSDLSFFVDFRKHFEASHSAVLPTNFRSPNAIVEAGNRIMHGKGTPGKCLPDKEGGEIHQRNIDEVWIECRPGNEYAALWEADRKFRFLRTLEDGREVCDDPGEIVARYLKLIYEIITDSRNAGKDVAILSRTNQLHHLRDLSVFVRKLKSCFTPQQVEQLGGKRAVDRNVRIGTVHSFKGLEADIVFLLRACEGAFPFIHPDFTLFRLFGDSEQQILEDERRLFYIALTRAKEQVWFLTETDRESDFVRELIGTDMPNQSIHLTGNPRRVPGM